MTIINVNAVYEPNPIRSASEFLEVLRVRCPASEEFGRRLSADENYLGGRYIRGEPRDDWPLIPPIGRVHSYAGKRTSGFDEEQERLLLNRFRRQSFLHFNRTMSAWEALFVARHFGLPVRLLDWTSNPLVALYWACQSEMQTEKPDSNGVLWLISRRPPPGEFLDILDESIADPFTVKGIRTVVPLFVDARLSAQASVFTIHENPRKPMNEMLAMGIEERDCDVKSLVRWTVPADAKSAILVELEKMGVNARSLLPDLTGLCLGLWRTELARRGNPIPAPNPQASGQFGSPCHRSVTFEKLQRLAARCRPPLVTTTSTARPPFRAEEGLAACVTLSEHAARCCS